MTTTERLEAPLAHPDRFFIGGEWVAPSTDSKFNVIEAHTEDVFFQVAEAQAADMDRAVTAAYEAFHRGPWPRMPHAERATYLRAFADGIGKRAGDLSEIWPRQSGIIQMFAHFSWPDVQNTFEFYANLADGYEWETPYKPPSGLVPGGEFGLLVREPVGVVGAIIPWNAPLHLIAPKVAPALLAGCTCIVKSSPEAPGEALVLAEIAESIGLPPGVLNVLTADREVSELLVKDERVDKIGFTGSTAAGRKIGAIMGGRIGRFTLELGGKSAAVILDDADIATAAATLAGAECLLAGQVCASLTRIVVTRSRHDEMVEALAANMSEIPVGSPFDPNVRMGPLAMQRQRDRVEGYIAKGVEQGATLATGGGRPAHLDRGWFIEPTVFGNVDNNHVIAREEIFGPVLSVIPADDEAHAVEIANDTIYGLNASVFTNDIEKARAVAGRIRSGTVGHNNMRVDFSTAFGGFKQSGIGREGGREGLLPYLETKTILLDEAPAKYGNT